jgi:hypothetical protein
MDMTSFSNSLMAYDNSFEFHCLLVEVSVPVKRDGWEEVFQLHLLMDNVYLHQESYTKAEDIRLKCYSFCCFHIVPFYVGLICISEQSSLIDLSA